MMFLIFPEKLGSDTSYKLNLNVRSYFLGKIKICFPRKQELTFHATGLLRRRFCMKHQFLFPRENKENITYLSSAESAQSLVSVYNKED